MFFDETVHTDIVIAFYRALQRSLPDHMLQPVFLKCVQQYGEERGRRMAMRALKMGYMLDYNAYRACGEWASTRPELADSRPGEPIEGMSHSRNYHCLWCETFRSRNASDVGKVYCSEIDRSIVRGFNPDMHFELREYAHTGECCDFVFGPYNPAVELPRPVGGVKDFAFHCAHMYHSFCHTLAQSLPIADDVIEMADAILDGWHGAEFAEAIDQFAFSDFTGIC